MGLPINEENSNMNKLITKSRRIKELMTKPSLEIFTAII